MRQKMFWQLICVATAVLLCACNLLNALQPKAVLPTEPIIDDIEEPLTDEETLDESSEVILPTHTPEPALPERTEPWLVAVTREALYILDGGQEQRFTFENAGFIQKAQPAPNGGYLAVIRSEEEYANGTLWLELVNLHTGEVSLITTLTNDQTAYYYSDDPDIGEGAREANIAMLISSLVWSQDGSRLLFIGAQEGEFALPYLFDKQTGQISKLVDEKAHFFEIQFSPNEQTVIALAAFGFGTGAGFAMDGLWAISPQGTGVVELFDAEGGDFVADIGLFGWLDDVSLVISTIDSFAGHKHLRVVDIRSGAVIYEILGPDDYFDNAAVAYNRGSIMFFSAMQQMLGDFYQGETLPQDGLYHWESQSGVLTWLNWVESWESDIAWNEATQCYYADVPKRAVDEDFIQPYTADGLISDECRAIASFAQTIPTLSPSLEMYAWSWMDWQYEGNNGLYAGFFDDPVERKVMAGSVATYVWHPQEDILYFVFGDQVYEARPPELLPISLITISEEIRNLLVVQP
jgi:hypothetical protein